MYIVLFFSNFKNENGDFSNIFFDFKRGAWFLSLDTFLGVAIAFFMAIIFTCKSFVPHPLFLLTIDRSSVYLKIKRYRGPRHTEQISPLFLRVGRQERAKRGELRRNSWDDVQVAFARLVDLVAGL